jgi:alpha-galactosidase
MKTFHQKDCFVHYDETGIEIGNSLVSRKYRLEKGLLYAESVTVPASSPGNGNPYCWQGENIPVGSFGLDMDRCDISFLPGEEDKQGLAEPCMFLDLVRSKNGLTLKTHWTVLQAYPFVTCHTSIRAENKQILDIQDDTIDAVGVRQVALKLISVQLGDKTDRNDNLLIETPHLTYPPELYRAQGNIFIINDYLTGNNFMIVKEAPVPGSAAAYPGYDLLYTRNSLTLCGSGLGGAEICSEETFSYGSTIGAGGPDLRNLYKRYYRAMSGGTRQQRHYVMSNTWGDRSQDSAVCHDFMMREIEIGAEMGVDIVQIDDGWQKGITINSALRKDGVFAGYYAVDPGFWELNSVKFPEGLSPLADQARQKGIQLGLWFSPDSSNDFANWKKDVEVLTDLYRCYGIRYFKIDGVQVNSKTAERNFISFLTGVGRYSGGAISLNMDITAGNRFGYLYEKHQGTLFVENRYTDWGNYYPHRTLRNLWVLSKYFPPERFQFEILNVRRNRDKYPDIPFAPENYPVDYLFASVMVSNPLIWMEMYNLEAEDREKLGKIIRYYKSIRDDFTNADIYPIGEEPDGMGFTGFQVVLPKGGGYLLLFREAGGTAEYTYGLARPINGRIDLRYAGSNGGVPGWEQKADGLDFTVTMDKPRSFGILQYQC